MLAARGFVVPEQFLDVVSGSLANLKFRASAQKNPKPYPREVFRDA
jgi:hypothetical protein